MTTQLKQLRSEGTTDRSILRNGGAVNLDSIGTWNRDAPGGIPGSYGQPAVDFQFAAGRGSIGFINPVSEPFCGDCNRLRLTAEGQVRNCLFSTVEWDARRVLREGGSDDDLRALVRESVAAKAAAHGIGQSDFHQPERAMYQIGG